MISVNANTRQFTIPGADLTFGVEADNGTERKHFQCPRYVGDNLDVAACFVRINYRNANGENDSYLVEDVAVSGDNVTFSWLLHPKVTAYKGQIKFVMCLVGPDLKLKWHTTQGTGQVLEGLEPDNSHVESDTADAVAALIAMVEAQTAAVGAKGAEQVAVVNSAAEIARTNAVAEIEAKRANSLASIPENYSALSTAVEKLARSVAPGIACDAAGTVIALNDASNNGVLGLRIFGRSTQDGVPTPSNPVEIKSVENPVVTVAGKNLVDFVSALGDGYSNTLNGITAVLKNGVVTTSGKNEYSGWTDIIHTRDIWGIDKYVLPAGTYTVPVGMNVITTDLVLGTSKNVRGTFAQDNLFCVRGFYITYNQGETANDRIPLVMVYGTETPTAYEPYKAVQAVETAHSLHGIPVTSGGNYTDENGQQWICDEVDLERGVYVQRVGRRVFDGTESTWRRGTLPTGEAMNYLYLADSTVENVNRSVCSHAVFAAGGGEWVKGGYMRSGTGYWQTISDMTLDGWKAYLAAQFANGTPLTLCHMLSQAVETPLTETELAAYRTLHTNKPNTTILNDNGAHMAVEYVADTKLYIDSKIKMTR